MAERQFYVWIEIHEYGDDPRKMPGQMRRRMIGPFCAENEDELREALEELGYDILRIDEPGAAS